MWGQRGGVEAGARPGSPLSCCVTLAPECVALACLCAWESQLQWLLSWLSLR